MDKTAPVLYKVKDLDGDERFQDLHVNLPRPPSCCVLVGSIKSGKSNTVINMLMREDMYKNRFDVVRVLSATLHLDKKMMLLDKYFHCDDHYEDKYIDSIVKSQGQYQKDDPNRPKYCLVMDDILSPEFNKRNSALSLFMTKMRHYIDMCIISVQSINHIPPLIRAQTRDLIIAKQQNHKEVIKLMEQYGGLLGENGDKKFIQLYNQVHKDQMYQLMYLKLSENPIHIFKNFNERIF
mgnify:FL=1|jgi:hypothetical protein